MIHEIFQCTEYKARDNIYILKSTNHTLFVLYKNFQNIFENFIRYFMNQMNDHTILYIFPYVFEK